MSDDEKHTEASPLTGKAAISSLWAWVWAAPALLAHVLFAYFAHIGTGRGFAGRQYYEALYLRDLASASGAPAGARFLFDPAMMAGTVHDVFARGSSVYYLLTGLFGSVDPDAVARVFTVAVVLATPILFFFTLRLLRLDAAGTAAGMLLFIVYFWTGFPALCIAAGRPEVVLSASLAVFAAAAAYNILAFGGGGTVLLAVALAAAMLSHRSGLVSAGIPIACLLAVFRRGGWGGRARVLGAVAVAAAFNSRWFFSLAASGGGMRFIPDAAEWRVAEPLAAAREFFTTSKLFMDGFIAAGPYNGLYILSFLKLLILFAGIAALFGRFGGEASRRKFFALNFALLGGLCYFGSLSDFVSGAGPTLYVTPLDYFLIAAAVIPVSSLVAKLSLASRPVKLLARDLAVFTCLLTAALAAANGYALSRAINLTPGAGGLSVSLISGNTDGTGRILFDTTGMDGAGDVPGEVFYLASKMKREFMAANFTISEGECAVEAEFTVPGKGFKRRRVRFENVSEYFSLYSVRWIITASDVGRLCLKRRLWEVGSSGKYTLYKIKKDSGSQWDAAAPIVEARDGRIHALAVGSGGNDVVLNYHYYEFLKVFGADGLAREDIASDPLGFIKILRPKGAALIFAPERFDF